MSERKGKSTIISMIDRKRIFIFLTIAYGIIIASAVVIFLEGGQSTNMSLLAGIMLAVLPFAPAIGHLATRLITREGWSNTFLRPNLRRGWPFYLAAWLLPLIAIIMGGAIYYLLFPGKFDLSMSWARETGKIPVHLATDPWTVVMGQKVLNGFRQVLWFMFVIFGEEFGWRAYLLPKLMPLGSRKAFLLVGTIWGVWHWPIILMGFQYGTGYWGAPVVGPLLFVLIIMSPSAFFSWVTLRTGSVWPACIGHSVHNTFCTLMIYFHRGEPNPLIGPEPEGIAGCLGYVLLALLILLTLRALAQPAPGPVEIALAGNPAAVEKAADQAKLGTTL